MYRFLIFACGFGIGQKYRINGNISLGTVYSEIFVRVLFSRTFAYAKFRENNILAKCEITLSFTDKDKSCLTGELLTSQICLLTLFAKIKFSRKFLN